MKTGKLLPLIILGILSMLSCNTKKLNIGEKHEGGIIIYLDETGEHGLVCSIDNLGKFNLKNGKKACKEYTFMGKGDWYLPGVNEMDLIYKNLYKIGKADASIRKTFLDDFYWTSSAKDSENFSIYSFRSGFTTTTYLKYEPRNIRAVRAF